MEHSNQPAIQKITTRLKWSSILFVGSQLLSVVAFYYYFTIAPLIPLLIGLSGWLPAAIMLMSWFDLRSLKLEKPQQPHYPPQRPHNKKGEG